VFTSRGEKSGRTRPVGHCNDAAVRGAAGGHHGAMTNVRGVEGVGMTPPEIAAAYARIEKVWRSATRQSKQIYLVQPAQLDTAAAADLDLEQPEVRDLIRGIRMLERRIQLALEPPGS